MRRFPNNDEILNRVPPNHHSIPWLFFAQNNWIGCCLAYHGSPSKGNFTFATLLKLFIFEDRTVGVYTVTSRHFLSGVYQGSTPNECSATRHLVWHVTFQGVSRDLSRTGIFQVLFALFFLKTYEHYPSDSILSSSPRSFKPISPAHSVHRYKENACIEPIT